MFCFSRNLSVVKLLQSCSRKRLYFTYSPELTQVIKGKEPRWVSADEALGCVMKSDSLVFIQGAAATPQMLIAAMTKVAQCNNLKNITLCHIHTEGTTPYLEGDMWKIFRSMSFFMGANVRKPISEGHAECVSIFLGDIPKVFHTRMYVPDVCLIHVSPPDKHGFCSLGTSVDCVRAALTKSKTIVAQVNQCMPRTFGDGTIHKSHLDYCVECNTELPAHNPGVLSEAEDKIGGYVADNLVDDGSTLQMGIGAIPDACLAHLKNHRDLGIHSEMFAGGIVDLVNLGCVTNNKKKIHRGRTVGSFVIGPRKLYDFLDNNPSVEMLVIDYVNNLQIIRMQPKMVCINSCIEVDLTGQVVSDSIGTRFYSGFGGQIDFIRGAAETIDGKGKPIIALQSVTKKGASKIVPLIQPGAGVVTTRGHVHYIVTEYGIASLFGKTMRQRAYALINIAHPDHRESLEKAAFERLKIEPSP